MKLRPVSIPDHIKIQDIINRLIKVINGKLASDNLEIWKLEGTTAGVADTSSWFKHGLNGTPKMYLPIKGDVYIEEYGQAEVNVQSRLTDEQFEVYLIS